MANLKEHMLVLLLGLLLALSIGFSYATGNQHTYLVDGLRMIDPAFLQYDWFATQTTHYHGNFGAVLWLINQLMPLPLGTVLLNTALIVLSVWGLLQLIRTCEIQRPLSVLSILVALMIFTHSSAVGQSYIYSAYLQPSSIASVFWCLACVWLIKRSCFIAGLLLLVSGFFHTNFLLLGLSVFGLVNLGLGRSEFVKRCMLSMGPACLYLLYLLPGLLALSGNEFGAQSRDIYQQIRSPHHYVPMTYLEDFVKYIGMCLLGLAFCLESAAKSESLKVLRLLFFSIVLLVLSATVLTTVVFVPFVSQLFPWRMAPFSNLLAQLMVAITVVRMLDGHYRISRKSSVVYAAGFALVCGYYFNNAGIGYWPAVVVFVLIVTAEFWLGRIKPLTNAMAKQSIYAVAVIAVLSAVLLRGPAGLQKSNLLHPMPEHKQVLFDWVKSHTAKEAQFVIPPGFGDFRLGSGRAVVVDWKSPPILPDEVILWYERIGDISGRPDILSLQQANRAYSEMDPSRLAKLKAKYRLDYAVFYRDKEQSPLSESLPGSKVVFENDKYRVIAF